MPRPARRFALATLVGLIALGAGLAVRSDEKPEPKLAHMVFFTLKDRSKESREKFVASCDKYLTNHEGAEFYAVGTIAEDVVEPVSERDWDVALHVVFATKAAEAKYLKHPRHTQFVEENKDHFAKVRVFDSYIQKK